MILETTTTVVVSSPDTINVLVDKDSTVRVTETNTYSVVSEQGNTVVTENNSPVSVVSAGSMGPPGPPGNSSYFTYVVAGENLSGHRCVALDILNKAIYPVNIPTTIGITTGSALNGELATVQTHGVLTELSWSWTIGLPIFVGALGSLTQTPPLGDTCIIAFATSTNTIFIDKQSPVLAA